ncbi:HAD-IIA family hydrolase [Amycolatopsis acidicola]|uniref:HAD-IIA family hydrolase n=1 Tax=Amycolatopsis acidicola TaxID=2596893 RepID=A0A5N0UL11_9PSEU|nr:HAD-IIA family hydrolase [Amycolatopsis acidicola]KAA9149690.1 HAD-IIA family hydrolase [Amycolatopsis acidicola]
MTDGDTLLSLYDAVLLDLDGTVYHGPRPIPGVAEAIRDARGHGAAVRFVTNNASKAPGDVVETLRSMQIDAEIAEVSTSAQAGAKLAWQQLDEGQTVLVVGAPALIAEVEALGLRAVREYSEDVAAVVQGHWPGTGWKHLAEAALAIRGGARWVACNVDVTLPTERGLLPGNGAMVAALRAATGAEPAVAGKPAAPLLRTASESAGARKPLVVGDRLDTDIAGGVAAGFDSLLVLTGVSTPADLLAAAPEERPTYVAAELSALAAPAKDLLIGPRDGWRVRVDSDALAVAGDGARDGSELLRALCEVAWESGVTTVRAEDEAARAALAGLGFTSAA